MIDVHDISRGQFFSLSKGGGQAQGPPPKYALMVCV